MQGPRLNLFMRLIESILCHMGKNTAICVFSHVAKVL